MQNFLRSRVIFFLVLFAALNSCSRPNETSKNVRNYQSRGFIRSFSTDHRTVEIQHEEVPDFMAAMTMHFEVQDPKTTVDLKVGDAVLFELAVIKDKVVIDRLTKIDPGEVHLATPSPTP